MSKTNAADLIKRAMRGTKKHLTFNDSLGRDDSGLNLAQKYNLHLNGTDNMEINYQQTEDINRIPGY